METNMCTGERGAHKDAIAGGRCKVCGVVQGQPKALVRHHDGRLREPQHIRHHLAAHTAGPVLYCELASGVLVTQQQHTLSSRETESVGGYTSSTEHWHTWSELESLVLNRLWLRQEGV